MNELEYKKKKQMSTVRGRDINGENYEQAVWFSDLGHSKHDTTLNTNTINVH